MQKLKENEKKQMMSSQELAAVEAAEALEEDVRGLGKKSAITDKSSHVMKKVQRGTVYSDMPKNNVVKSQVTHFDPDESQTIVDTESRSNHTSTRVSRSGHRHHHRSDKDSKRSHSRKSRGGGDKPVKEGRHKSVERPKDPRTVMQE